MTPAALQQFLSMMICNHRYNSLMIWGPPGIGKSSIVAQVAQSLNLDLKDLTLNQLGSPLEGVPTEGRGILLLEGLNQATPMIQGMVQHLILTRQMGSTPVPEGWFIWATGTPEDDQGSASGMIHSLANCFLHLQVEPDLNSFRDYAVERGLHPAITAFLAHRPQLLHQIDPNSPAWPSPRTWELASHLLKDGLDISMVLGANTAREFHRFMEVYSHLPNLDLILQGSGHTVPIPADKEAACALITALAEQASLPTEVESALDWLTQQAPSMEWIQLFLHELMARMRRDRRMTELIPLLQANSKVARLLKSLGAGKRMESYSAA